MDRFAATVARLRSAGCVYAEDEARLLISAAETPEELDALVARRAGGAPLEHVLGWAEFCGLRIAVEPGVFVPRRRSEFLAQQAIAVGRAAGVVVDLCCGTGALGVAVTRALGRAQLHAVDLDPAAVRCARRNVAAVGGRVYEGDLDTPLPAELAGRVDVLVANAPYVPSAEMRLLPAEARLHEPIAALDGGVDGLAVLRRVAALAPRWLAARGHLLTETSEAQAPKLADTMREHGMKTRTVHCERLGATVVIGISEQPPAIRPAEGRNEKRD